jgi:hypothetical protein
MNLNAISFESLQLSTVHFVTTKTRHVKTVVKSVIANTTVPSNATSLQTLSAVPVEMPDIWPEIAQIVKRVPIGATDLHHLVDSLAAQVLLVPQLAELVAAMLLTVRWR